MATCNVALHLLIKSRSFAHYLFVVVRPAIVNVLMFSFPKIEYWWGSVSTQQQSNHKDSETCLFDSLMCVLRYLGCIGSLSNVIPLSFSPVVSHHFIVSY